MSFGSAPTPAPMIMPAPPPAVPPLSPTTVKPPRKPMQVSFLSSALTPGAGQAPERSLIGGAPTTFGA